MTKTAQNFEMWQGNTKSLAITVTGSDGSGYDLIGASATYVMEREPGSGSLIRKTTSGSEISISGSVLTVVLNPTDTLGLDGLYYHEAGIVNSVSQLETIMVGNIKINKSGVGLVDYNKYAIDYGVNNLKALHFNVVLGGDVNRAYYAGDSLYGSYTNIYSPDLNTLYNGNEVTAIIRGALRYPTALGDGTVHSLLSIYTYPFGNDLTIDISATGLLEWTMMTGGFPGIILRQVTVTDLGWMTLGTTVSQSAGEMRAYKEGLQQGAPLGAGIDWSRPLWVNGCYIGAPSWKGWGADCIISFGVVATPTQMLTIHNKLDTQTLTGADLNTIFGIGKYAWWKLNED